MLHQGTSACTKNLLFNFYFNCFSHIYFTFEPLKKMLMPGFELWSDAERKEVNEVLETGILMRYGFDGARNGKWKSKELEAEICKRFNCNYAQLVSSGTAALTTALAALGIGAGDEVIMP